MKVMVYGHAIIIDDEDSFILKYNWFSSNKKGLIYFRRHIRKNGKRSSISMHREIIMAPDGFDVDHINGNTLDNRKSNLRICTHSQNMMNSNKKHNVMNKGVSFSKHAQKWRAQIRHGNKNKHLGYFDSPIDAAKAYKDASLEIHKEYSFYSRIKAE